MAESTKSNQQINVPTNKQLSNYLQHQKKGSNTMNFAQLNEWSQSNKSVPIDNHQPFLVSYQIKIDNDEDDTIQFPEDNNISIRSLSFRIF